jgi:outer membrane protein assembly factor BamD
MQAVGNTFIKLSSITLLALSVNLVGCQTFKNLTGGKDVDAVATAEKSEQGYYNDAIAQQSAHFLSNGTICRTSLA